MMMVKKKIPLNPESMMKMELILIQVFADVKPVALVSKMTIVEEKHEETHAKDSLTSAEEETPAEDEDKKKNCCRQQFIC
ncbi:hypothetical protein EVAR_50389_1 [Eumeta japonica]|uniref:Uncharacterized protein n=1 Tax=Eumeta variegata TaxID=151549 RepID=A0A4C1WY41_EUMVA|nr:hypothetical protein EVAR_50389_1 [Eumeta japonica]